MCLDIDIVPKLTRGFPIRAVFCDPHYLDSFKQSLRQLSPQPSLVINTSLTDEIFNSLMRTEGELEVYQVQDVHKHIPFIFFSSGTTGDPKGIQIKDIYVQHCGHWWVDLYYRLIGIVVGKSKLSKIKGKCVCFESIWLKL